MRREPSRQASLGVAFLVAVATATGVASWALADSPVHQQPIASPPVPNHSDGQGDSEFNGSETFEGKWRVVHGIGEGTEAVHAVHEGDEWIKFREPGNYDGFNVTVAASWSLAPMESEWKVRLYGVTSCARSTEWGPCDDWTWDGQDTSPLVTRFTDNRFPCPLDNEDGCAAAGVRPSLHTPSDWPVTGYGTNVDIDVRWRAVVEYS